MISLVFVFKVTFKIMFFYQIRPQTVSEVTIFLVFPFKVMIFIRLGNKLSVK